MLAFFNAKTYYSSMQCRIRRSSEESIPSKVTDTEGIKGWQTSLVHEHLEHPLRRRRSSSGNWRSLVVIEIRTRDSCRGLLRSQNGQKIRTFEMFLGAKVDAKGGERERTRCLEDALILARRVFSRLLPLGPIRQSWQKRPLPKGTVH